MTCARCLGDGTGAGRRPRDQLELPTSQPLFGGYAPCTVCGIGIRGRHRVGFRFELIACNDTASTRVGALKAVPASTGTAG